MEYYVCDHDPLFTKEFRKTLDGSGVEVIDSLRSGLRPIAARCPSALRYVERVWVARNKMVMRNAL